MSLRVRLLASMAVVALVIVCVAITVTRTTEGFLIGRVDAQLLADRAPGRLLGREPRGGRDDPPSSIYIGFIDGAGSLRTLVAPNNTGETLAPPDLPIGFGDNAGDPGRRPEPVTVGTDPESGSRYRVIARRDRRSDRLGVVGIPLDEVDAVMARLVAVEVVASSVILGLLALVVFWFIRLGLAPLKAMSRTATAIAAGELSHRVPSVAPRTEAGQLGMALNQMLGRIEEAFEHRTRSEARLRQFVSDASHELRTPVTTIRGYAELYRTGGLTGLDQLDEAMRRTEQEAIRMGTMVDDLLLLARLDQGRPLERAPVELGSLVHDAANDARAIAPLRPITTSVDGPLPVTGDEGRLRQVLANLVNNALVHTGDDTAMHLEAISVDGRAVVMVSDDGPGMPADVAARVFERFYRGDPARSRQEGSSGLGLAIVDAIVGAHGGVVSVHSQPLAGTSFRVELPLAGSASAVTEPERHV